MIFLQKDVEKDEFLKRILTNLDKIQAGKCYFPMSQNSDVQLLSTADFNAIWSLHCVDLQVRFCGKFDGHVKISEPEKGVAFQKHVFQALLYELVLWRVHFFPISSDNSLKLLAFCKVCFDYSQFGYSDT